MKWLELSLEVSSEDVEPVVELFRRYGHGGVAIDENITVSEDGDSFSVNPEKPAIVKTYVPKTKQGREQKAQIDDGLGYLSFIHPFSPLRQRTIDEKDWANAWKDHFNVHRVGERLLIKPPWRDYQPTPEDILIEIDPGMAFGTGLHPTTKLCLVAIEQRLRPGMSVLDLGTGSGILAIGAARLGASNVLGLDTDSVAVVAAKANIKANGIERLINVRDGTLTPGEAAGPFDLIAANIIARVIIELAEELLSRLAPGGTLICGGILDQRLDEVLQRYEDLSVDLKEITSEDDWRTVVFQK